MAKLAKALSAAAGNAAGDPVYVEEVFSNYLYNGVNGVNTITNGIDFAGEGGLVWCKDRNYGNPHRLYDTARGINKYLDTASTANQGTNTGSGTNHGIDQFNSNGFRIGGQDGSINDASSEYLSWSFRKQKGFCDVVSFSGDGTSNRDISHSVDATIGSIIFKRTDTYENWYVYHRNIDSDITNAPYYKLSLNNSDAKSNNGSNGIVGVTTSTFRVHGTGNVAGATYVAYIFAAGESDSQIFGDGGDEAIIKCGSATTDASGVLATDVDLGFEAQWLLVKRSDSTGPWNLFDTMRGFHGEKIGNNKYVRADNSNAEGNNASVDGEFITATGFGTNGNGVMGSANAYYIYVAIRRGPMKEPSAGTDVFNGVFTYSNGSGFTGFPVSMGFPVDLGFIGYTNWGTQISNNRLMGLSNNPQPATGSLSTYVNNAQANTGEFFGADNMTGFRIYGHSYPRLCYGWRRYPKVFDIVYYTGNGSPSNGVRNGLNHALTVAPELVIHKRADSASEWQAGATPVAKGGYFNLTNSFTASFTPANEFTATTFDVDGWISENNNNVSGGTYVAYLFATLAGISKVGSYTGTGNNLNVDCGFSGGARFVMIKRTDGSGDWYYWDTIRGISASNDPYLRFNQGAGEVTNTNYIDPLASGFIVTSSAPAALNASGGTYLFLAFA